MNPVGTGQDGSAARLAILVRRWRQALAVGRAAAGRPMSKAQKARVLLKVRNLVLGPGRVRERIRATWSQVVGEKATNGCGAPWTVFQRWTSRRSGGLAPSWDFINGDGTLASYLGLDLANGKPRDVTYATT